MVDLTDGDDDDDIGQVNNAEFKSFEITEGGRTTTKTTTAKPVINYHHVRNASVGYGHYQQPEFAYGAPSHAKVYCSAVYHILLHLALFYCLFGVTYAIFFQKHKCECSVTDMQSIDVDHVSTTYSPTMRPLTSEPSVIPTATTRAGPETRVPSSKPWFEPSAHPTPNPTNQDALFCGDHAIFAYEDEMLTFTVYVGKGLTLTLDFSKSDILVNDIKAYYDTNGSTVSDASFGSDAQKIAMYAPYSGTYRFKLSAKQRGNIFIEVYCEKIETFLPTLQPTREPTYERVRMDEYNEFKTSMEAAVDTLTKNVESMNTTLWTSSSMVTGWPDAIACTGSSWGHTVYYLVHAPHNDLRYWYRLSDSNTYHQFYFSADGEYNSKTGGMGTTNCDGKSITQLYSEGQAFNFVSLSKQ